MESQTVVKSSVLGVCFRLIATTRVKPVMLKIADEFKSSEKRHYTMSINIKDATRKVRT